MKEDEITWTAWSLSRAAACVPVSRAAACAL